jgi:glutamate--cysteine ligase
MKDDIFTIDTLNALRPEEICSGHFGVERESLRAYADGRLALTPHPPALGNKLTNAYVTTDFSESQVEIVTPPCASVHEAYETLEALTDMVNAVLPEDEYLWPNSIPCVLPDDRDIPIARYAGAPGAEKAMVYRRSLVKKYGAKKQMFSGIHFNYSLGEEAVRKLYQKARQDRPSMTFQDFKNRLYLKIAKNYLTYRWFLIFLTGASIAAHDTFIPSCLKLMPWSDGRGSHYSKKGISFRSGSPGYKNNEALYPRYDSIDHFINDLEAFVAQGKLSEPKEFYAQARLKPAHPKEDWMGSLKRDGIMYIEIRTMDLNPFDPCGISEMDMDIVHLLLLYCLIKPVIGENSDRAEADDNERRAAEQGLDEFLVLHRNGEAVLAKTWAREIVRDIDFMNQTLKLGKDAAVAEMQKRLGDVRDDHAVALVRLVEDQGYISSMSRLAQNYKAASLQRLQHPSGAYEEALVRFKAAVPDLT